MAFYAFMADLVSWVCWGCQMSFREEMLPFWGKPNAALGQKYLLTQGFAGAYRAATLVYFSVCVRSHYSYFSCWGSSCENEFYGLDAVCVIAAYVFVYYWGF